MSLDEPARHSDVEASVEPAAEARDAPIFNLDELKEHIRERLGGGQFGDVYAINGFPGLAVKEFRLDGLGASALRSLRFELATLTTFTHPGILRYHQIIEDEDGDLIYIVMDRHDTFLETLIMKHRRRREPIPAEKIVDFVGQVAGALAYLHGFCGTDANGNALAGIVHRNLKPTNVLVSENRKRVILADFGLCKNAQHDGSTLAGIKPYMAPETLLYNSTSPASDIWALGVIIYELAVLKKPNFLEGKEPKDVFINGWRPDLSAVEDDSIKSILERIFILDPAKRPKAKELASLLQTFDISGDKQQVQGTALEDRCMFLEAILKDASARIAALEGQCKEHLAMMRALEDKITLLTASNPQFELLLLPRLMRAAHTNSTETVRMLVESGDRIGKRDEQGRTALMHAAQQGHVEPARLLVEKEKGLQDKSGWTALMHAVHGNHPGVVEILATHECGKRDVNGRTALMIAAEGGHTEIVTALAPHEKGLTDSSGNTALMFAASNAHIETVRRLAEHEKGMTDEDGRTALVLAARAGHREAAELLMEHEKDVTGWTMLTCAAVLGDVEIVSQHLGEKGQKDNLGQTALILAARNGRNDVVNLLMRYESGVSGWTKLIYGAYLGDVDAVRDNLHKKGCKDVIGMTALMYAAAQGHAEVVQMLIQHEGGLKDEDGWTALMWAAQDNHVDCVGLLLEKEGGAQDKDARTALMFAVEHDHIECVKLLLEKEAGMRDKDGLTALMWTAWGGHLECMKLLVEKEVGMQDKDGMTALMSAAQNDHTDYVKLLLEQEAGIQDKDGWTALMLAAINDHIECVKLLLEKEKSMKTTCEWCEFPPGTTALILAAYNGRAEVVRLLMKYESSASGWTSLICAAYLGDVDAVKNNLHEKGCKDITEMTALMWAAQQGHREAVEVLLEHEKGLKDTEGITAFTHALRNKHVDVAMILLEHEAPSWTSLMCAAFTGDVEIAKKHFSDKDKKNSDGETALMIAARMEHEDIVELLDPTDKNGITALMRAVERGDVETVRALIPLQKGRKMTNCICTNELWISNGTALMMAAARGHTEVVKLLVEHEGGMRDDLCKTALMWAAFFGHIGCVKLLAEKEAYMQDKDSWTALICAAKWGHSECVNLLVKRESTVSKWTDLICAAYRGDINAVKNNFHMRGNQDVRGWTALMYAVARGHTEVAKLLAAHEGGMQDKDGETALMVAAYWNRLKCVRLLAEREKDLKLTHELRGFPPGTTALDIAKKKGYKEIVSVLRE